MRLHAIRPIGQNSSDGSKGFVMAINSVEAVKALLSLVGDDARAYSDNANYSGENIVTTHDGVELAVRPL